MKQVLYLKTPQGAKQLEARHSTLMDRERQILQMCTPSYPLDQLIGLFGCGVVRELHGMAARGWVAAALQLPEPGPVLSEEDPQQPPAPPDLAPTPDEWAALQALRDFATGVAQSLGAGEPERWVQQYSRSLNPDGVLRYGVLVVEHLFETGDDARALRVGARMLDALPRPYAARLVHNLLEGPHAHQASALYAHLLTGQAGPMSDDLNHGR